MAKSLRRNKSQDGNDACGLDILQEFTYNCSNSVVLGCSHKKFYNCTLNRQRVTYSFVITFDTQEKLDF